MNKKIPIGATITLMVISAIITFSLTAAFSMNFFDKSAYDLTKKQAMFNKLAEMDQKARAYYIGNIDEKNLMESLAYGYVAGLGDPYSTYLSAEQYREISKSLAGKSVGIGVDITSDEDGNIHILYVYPDSPASDQGVIAGDKIIKVDNDYVTDIGYDAAVQRLRGDIGTQAVFTVLRGEEEIPFTLVRTTFEKVTVFSEMVDQYGYIKITNFDDTTDEQFNDALDDIISKGAKGIIFDVRNNYGGTLSSVVNVLNRLLPEGVILSKVDKNNVKTDYTSDSKEENIKMVTIINERSASASELFACALRDYDKSKLVGVKTYGKGTMQEYIKLDDGSYMRLSIAKFLPPKSPNFDGKGVEPDVEVQLSEQQRENFLFLTKEQDPQFQAALELLKNSENKN